MEEEVPITVFFDEGTSEEEIQAIGDAIQSRPEVARMDYQSADQAWEEYKQKYFGDEDAADGFKDDNPLAIHPIIRYILMILPSRQNW